MRKTIIVPDRFGDPKRFSVLVSLAEILNENGNDNLASYVSSTLAEMHVLYKKLSCLEKKERRYFNNLVKDDFLSRTGSSWKEGRLPNNVYTHICNYITGYNRYMNKTFC